MIHRPSEARVTRGIGLALVTAIGAYFAYWVFENYGRGQDNSSAGTLVALAILLIFGIGGFVAFFINPKVSDFSIEIDTESRKVTWPTWDTVKASTLQVTVVMLFLLLFLFLVDFGFGYLRQTVL
jgi:preprotein translocase SecE subunit